MYLISSLLSSSGKPLPNVATASVVAVAATLTMGGETGKQTSSGKLKRNFDPLGQWSRQLFRFSFSLYSLLQASRTQFFLLSSRSRRFAFLHYHQNHLCVYWYKQKPAYKATNLHTCTVISYQSNWRGLKEFERVCVCMCAWERI